jgi:hypothetical protein
VCGVVGLGRVGGVVYRRVGGGRRRAGRTHAPPSSEMVLKRTRSRVNCSEGQEDVATMVLRLRDVGGYRRGSSELAGFMWLELPAGPPSLSHAQI